MDCHKIARKSNIRLLIVYFGASKIETVGKFWRLIGAQGLYRRGWRTNGAKLETSFHKPSLSPMDHEIPPAIEHPRRRLIRRAFAFARG